VIRVLLAKKEDLSRRGAIKFCQGAVVIDSTPVDPALRPLKNNHRESGRSLICERARLARRLPKSCAIGPIKG
jgi:hypothetical protein